MTSKSERSSLILSGQRSRTETFHTLLTSEKLPKFSKKTISTPHRVSPHFEGDAIRPRIQEMLPGSKADGMQSLLEFY